MGWKGRLGERIEACSTSSWQPVTAALVGAMSVVPPDPRRVAGVVPSVSRPCPDVICTGESRRRQRSDVRPVSARVLYQVATLVPHSAVNAAVCRRLSSTPSPSRLLVAAPGPALCRCTASAACTYLDRRSWSLVSVAQPFCRPPSPDSAPCLILVGICFRAWRPATRT